MGPRCGRLAVSMGKVPTGPVVVIVLFLAVAVSLLGAPERSIAHRRLAQRRRLRELLADARTGGRSS